MTPLPNNPETLFVVIDQRRMRWRIKSKIQNATSATASSDNIVRNLVECFKFVSIIGFYRLSHFDEMKGVS